MEIKKLGFGLMRLPKDENKVINVEEVKKMVDEFIEAGFNYFDTAWIYDGSEVAIKEALVDRYPRDKFFLASKNAAMICETKEEAYKQLDESLERSGAGYFDYYLLHCIKDNNIKKYEDFGMFDFVKKKKEEGLIKHYGFSFHGTPECLDKVLTDHEDVEFVQLQLNYADWNRPSVKSRECYETVVKHGKKVIVMEPVRGGRLASPMPKIKEIFDKENNGSYASWAIKFAADLDSVMVVLSGMSTLDQVKDNVSYMKEFKGLNDHEKEVINEVRSIIENADTTGCTGCDYCAKVCPNNIGISGFFRALDTLTIFGLAKEAQEEYDSTIKNNGKNKASECLKCGACESMCPQHIEIRDLLDKASSKFE